MNKTVGQILEELQRLVTKEQGKLWYAANVTNHDNAWANIKYITGYLGDAERNRILNLLKLDFS